MGSATDAQVVTAMEAWVDCVVVGLDLCPFARRERARNRVRFAVTRASTEDELLAALGAEIKRLEDDPAVETTLLVHPEVLADFLDYNQFLELVDALLVALDRDGVFQVASFHPHYQFAGTEPDDAENYTNRSPYPALHLLREASLDAAIDSHPDIDGIPGRNIERMNALGRKQARALLEACLR